MNKLIGAAVIGQSGGPSSVINASAYGAIKTALEVKAVLQDKVEGPTQITVRFENPAWAE